MLTAYSILLTARAARGSRTKGLAAVESCPGPTCQHELHCDIYSFLVTAYRGFFKLVATSPNDALADLFLPQLIAQGDDNDEKIMIEPKNAAIKPTNEFEQSLLPRCAMESLLYNVLPS